MKQITWDDIKKGDHIIVRQFIPITGPRKKYELEWCGVVTVHDMKWTRIKHDGVEMSVPTHWGTEEILRCTPAEFKAYVKETYA